MQEFWMNDWHLDDNEWVKLRKKAWREVKFNIDAFSEGWLNIDKEDKKQVEKYFLTGDNEALKVLYKMWDSLLIELWIYPSTDPAKLKAVFDRHIIDKVHYSEHPAYSRTVRNTFSGKTVHSPNVLFKGESNFNGRELLIDPILMPQTLSETLALETIVAPNIVIRRMFLGYCGRFESFFERNDCFEYDVCQNKVQLWRDALVLSFNAETPKYGIHKDRPEFKWFVLELEAINTNPENYQPCQLALAQKINDVLSEPEIAALVKDKVAEIIENGV